jgi:ribosomal protein S18 acetylase RimI-like enzyme
VPGIEQLQAFLRATAAGGREVVRVPPFVAYFNADDELKYVNYAIPDDDAAPSGHEIEALRRTFLERDRLPRLEWIAEAAPGVAAALEAAGMRKELATPLMACTRSELVVPDVDAEVHPFGASDAVAVRNMQRIAFGQPPLDAAGEESVSAEAPERTLLARIDGEIVSAAGWTEVIEGVSEIVGVATADSSRRRGLAGALTAAAAKAAFDEGADVCVLSPGDETAMRVYERAGFSRVATMLHWSDEG